jgi:hypothetical protein
LVLDRDPSTAAVALWSHSSLNLMHCYYVFHCSIYLTLFLDNECRDSFQSFRVIFQRSLSECEQTLLSFSLG